MSLCSVYIDPWALDCQWELSASGGWRRCSAECGCWFKPHEMCFSCVVVMGGWRLLRPTLWSGWQPWCPRPVPPGDLRCMWNACKAPLSKVMSPLGSVIGTAHVTCTKWFDLRLKLDCGWQAAVWELGISFDPVPQTSSKIYLCACRQVFLCAGLAIQPWEHAHDVLILMAGLYSIFEDATTTNLIVVPNELLPIIVVEDHHLLFVWMY